MDRAQIQRVLGILWDIKRNGPGGPGGICHAVSRALWEYDRGVEVARFAWEAGRAFDLWKGVNWERWPECSDGGFVYPVPGGALGYVSAAASPTGRNQFWVGEYGSARWRLLNWTIRELEAELARLEADV